MPDSLDSMIDFTGTKAAIFNTALKLFARNGFEEVSIRKLAQAVGIKGASIYNHYGSKRELLSDCLAFYPKYRHITRLSKKQYLPILKTGSKSEVLEVINFSYPADMVENMVYSLTLIFSRMYTDSDARNIYADEIKSSMDYLTEFFNAGKDIGRFRDFNAGTVSTMILSARLFTAQSCTLEAEQTTFWRNVECDMMDALTGMIPFVY